MTVDIERVVKLTEELKLAQERVRQLQVELAQAALGKPSGSMSQVFAETLTAISSAGDSTPEKILAAINANPTWNFDFGTLHKQIGGNDAYLRSLLSRMTKEGRIESRGWGKYGAKGGISLPLKEKAQNG